MTLDEVCRALDCSREDLAWAMRLNRGGLGNAPSDLVPLAVAVRLRHHVTPGLVRELTQALLAFKNSGAGLAEMLLVEGEGWTLASRLTAVDLLSHSDGKLTHVIDLGTLKARIVWNLGQTGKELHAATADR